MQHVQAFLGSSCLLLTALAVACDGGGASDSEPPGCHDAACRMPPASIVEFTFAEPGAYRFELTVDGTTVRCTASLPLQPPGVGASSCDEKRVNLFLSAGPQESVGPLVVDGEDTKRIEVQAFRDDVPIGTTAFDVQQVETPGPNGPGCEPEVCRGPSGGALK